MLVATDGCDVGQFDLPADSDGVESRVHFVYLGTYIDAVNGVDPDL